MSNGKTLLLSLSSALLVSCGGPIFFVEVEAPRICETLVNETIIGSPVPVYGTISHSFAYDIGDRLSSISLLRDAELRLLSVTLTAKEGVPDFNFVDQASIVLQGSSDGTLPPLSLTYTKDPAAPPGDSLVMTSNADILAYLKLGTLQMDASMTGQVPTNDWTLDIRLCIAAKKRINYLEERF